MQLIVLSVLMFVFVVWAPGAKGQLDQGYIYGNQQTTNPGYYPNRTVYSTPYNYSYRFSGAPAPLLGNYYGITSGSTQYRFWKAPSGYYYPWYAGAYPYAPPVIIYQQGAPAPALPSISTIFQDMQTMLDDAQSKGKVLPGDYEHLNRRLHDLIRMEQSARISGDGTLDTGQDADIRDKLNQLGVEISRRIRS